MDAETWLSGSAAIDKGFADALLASDKVTQDEKTKAEDRRVNEVRAMELQLMASGLSRTQARERINKIKGTPGAAPEAGTTDSVGAELVGPLSGLLTTIRS
jgi:ATP-dependent Clp protease protease subunit